MSNTNVPIKTGESTYRYPKAFILSEPMMAINAVAPPGGCKVLVICIRIMAVETARGAAIQMISGANLWTVTPIRAEITCPPTRFRGCEKGLWIMP